MNSTINWGLVIQGPIIGFGQGPNNSKSGFNAYEVIQKNIEAFAPYVEKIVVSTWVGSGFTLSNDDLSKGVALLENQMPSERDHDNRIKQFTSTLAGINFLNQTPSITHVVKIRTDQLIDPTLIMWLTDFYFNPPKGIDKKDTTQKNYLIFSEYRKDSPFYLGDFVIAGEKEDVAQFCKSNVSFGAKNLYPSIGIDYVLKYLFRTDRTLHSHFYAFIPMLWQVANLNNMAAQSYWANILHNRFSIIPKYFYETIQWRGRHMTEVLSPEVIAGFSFFEEWSQTRGSKRINLISKNCAYFFPNRQVFYTAKYEYIRYFRAIFKYYLKKLKVLR